MPTFTVALLNRLGLEEKQVRTITLRMAVNEPTIAEVEMYPDSEAIDSAELVEVLTNKTYEIKEL